jgi:hypothetical protein
MLASPGVAVPLAASQGGISYMTLVTGVQDSEDLITIREYGWLYFMPAPI